MSAHRRTTLTLASCLAALTAGCSAGITSASPPAGPAAPTTAVSHHTVTPPAATHSASPSAAAGSASVAGLGGFPIPPGAQVTANLTCGKGDIIQAGPVTPNAASAFYTAALPKAGYTISENTLGSIPGSGAIETVIFTGHGYSGVLIAMANLNASATGAASAPAISGSLSHNVLEVTLAPGGNPSDMPKC